MQVRPPIVPGPAEALPEPEIYARLAEAMDLFGDPPAELHELAPRALEADGAAAFLATAQQLAGERAAASPRSACSSGATAPSARTCPRRRSPPIWLQCAPERHPAQRQPCSARSARPGGRSERRSRSAPRSSGGSSPIRKASRSRASTRDRNLEDHVGVRRSADPPRARADDRELHRAAAIGARRTDADVSRSCSPPDCARAGRRTRSSAIRSGGRAAALTARSISRRADATRLGVSDGDALRVTTRRGSLTLPAQDRREADGRPRVDAERIRHAVPRRARTDRRRQPERADGRRGQGSVHRHPASPLRALSDRADLDAAQQRRSPGQLRHGSTRILACRSGEPRSSKAFATPSTPTLPVINGSTGILPSAIRAKRDRELFGCVAEDELEVQLLVDAEHRLDGVALHAHADHDDARAGRRRRHDLVDHAGNADALEDHRRAQRGAGDPRRQLGRLRRVVPGAPLASSSRKGTVSAGSTTTSAPSCHGQLAPARREVRGDDRPHVS